MSTTTQTDAVSSAASPAGTSVDRKQLPPLSAAEFRTYNKMSEHMDQFHNHFRQQWNLLYAAVSPVEWNNRDQQAQEHQNPAQHLSASRIVNVGTAFLSHLTTHHGIEEEHIFPLLATKMPAFRRDSRHIQQHRDIHAGLDKLGEYLTQVRTGERELRRTEIKENMETWGGVLWEHLDEEVQTLGAENMRKYWSIAEMRQMPM